MIEMKILSDEAIELRKIEADMLAKSYKIHPNFEREKYLLEFQAKETYDEVLDDIRITLGLRAAEKVEKYLEK